MAVFAGTVYSDVLKLRTGVQVIVPTDEIGAKAVPDATIYFLHGLTDNADAYSRWTNVAWLARKYNFAAVMGDVGRSWYCDMAYGARYFTYLTQELPRLLGKLFSLPEKTYLLGNSMGGYGAMKALLALPERYAGVAALSGAFDLERVMRVNPALSKEFFAIFGAEETVRKSDDVYQLARQTTCENKRIVLRCGLNDEFLPDTKRLADTLSGRGIPFDLRLGNGRHDWDYWNGCLEEAIQALLKKGQ